MLTLVGVGPGDPELMTLAAVTAIQQSQVVAYPVAGLDIESMAARIAARWIRSDHQQLPLLFPMVQAAAPRQAAWTAAATRLKAELKAGRRVALLCEGDSSLFATCSYVLLALQNAWPDCPLQVIPGITSLSAAAAAGLWPLALQDDHLLIRPCPNDADGLSEELDQAAANQRVLALLKLGKRWSWVRPLLEKRELLQNSLFAERIGWSDQRICPATQMPASERPYFSLLLIRQAWPEVLP